MPTTIGLADPQEEGQPAYLRTEFDVDSPVSRATLYATAVGVYQVALNGADVDDQVMKPGWTPYQYRTIHETTDVTGLVHEGRNAIGVRLAGAWGTEHFGFRENSRLIYGDQPRFAAQLLVEYADGSSEWVKTDASWHVVDRPDHRERPIRRRALRRPPRARRRRRARVRRGGLRRLGLARRRRCRTPSWSPRLACLRSSAASRSSRWSR